MKKWYLGAIKARYVSHRKKISKLLNLDDQRFLFWRNEIVSRIAIDEKGGWVNGDWVKNLTYQIVKSK